MACAPWCNQYTSFSPDCAACSGCSETGCSGAAFSSPSAVPQGEQPAAGNRNAGEAIAISTALNLRFVKWRLDGGLRDAGVLIHQVDAMDTGVTHAAWLPCRITEWCAKFRDRFSASLVNAALPFVFDKEAIGFVVAPDVAVVLCAYAGDGGTMQRTCEPMGQPLHQCTPGCSSGGSGAPHWCKDDAWMHGPRCPWRPSQILQMVMEHERDISAGRRQRERECGQQNCMYNEVVLDANAWVGKLLLPARCPACRC